MTYLDSLVSDAMPGTKPVSDDMSGNILSNVNRLKSIEDARENDPKIVQLRQRQQDTGEKDIAATDKAYGGIEPIGDRVKPWNADDEAAKRTTDPLKQFGSAGSVFAMIASAFTHTPMVNALNGAAAAMNAIQAGDKQAYDRAYEAWKSNTDLALRRHDAQMQDFNAAIAKGQSDTNQMNAMLKTYAAKYDDQVVAIAAENGDYAKIAEIQQARENSARAWAQIKPQIELANISISMQLGKLQATQNYQKAVASGDSKAIDKAQQELEAYSPNQLFGSMTTTKLAGLSAELRSQAVMLPDGDPQKAQLNAQADQIDNAIAKTKTAETPNIISDDTAKLVAERIIAGDPNATKNMSRNQASMTKVEDAVTRMAKERNLSGFDLMLASAAVRADQSALNNIQKMTTAAVSFENTAEKNFNYALSIAPQAIPDLGPWINKWVETGETGTGNQNVPPYIAALLTGANEYAKIMSGSTGAQGSTVDSRREAAEIFSPYLNTGQIRRVIEVARNDMKNRQKSLDESISNIKAQMKGESGNTNPVMAPPESNPDVIKYDSQGNRVQQ